MEANKLKRQEVLLVLDREKLEKNLFWKALTERINEQRVISKDMCENAVSAPLDKIRYHQGQVAAWNLFFQLPDLILEDLSKEEVIRTNED